MKYILVLLGNPGEKYKNTRHNVARIVGDFVNNEFACEVLIPDTYMNDSGKAVKEYLHYHDDTEVVVMYDDKDLPFGKFRISHDRGDGGHNGLKSVITELGTREFVRVRVGIAHKDTDGKDKIPLFGDVVQKYVMSNCTEEDMEVLKEVAPKIKEAIAVIVSDGYQKAMEKFN